MHVLVTGAAGYVGSVLVDVLLRAGHQVRGVDALAHGPAPSLLLAWGEDEFEFVRADVTDADAMGSAVVDVDAVVHLAAIVGDPACAREPELAKAINVGATRALVRAARDRDVGRFVFASTCSNYGKLDDPNAFATEDWPLRPVSLYAETKVEAELDVLEQSADGFETCCLRLATVYGVSPRMRFDLTVNEFTRDVLLAGDLVVYGEQFWRPYVHVRDAAAAVLAVSRPRRSRWQDRSTTWGRTRRTTASSTSSSSFASAFRPPRSSSSRRTRIPATTASPSTGSRSGWASAPCARSRRESTR